MAGKNEHRHMATDPIRRSYSLSNIRTESKLNQRQRRSRSYNNKNSIITKNMPNIYNIIQKTKSPFVSILQMETKLDILKQTMMMAQKEYDRLVSKNEKSIKLYNVAKIYNEAVHQYVINKGILRKMWEDKASKNGPEKEYASHMQRTITNDDLTNKLIENSKKMLNIGKHNDHNTQSMSSGYNIVQPEKNEGEGEGEGEEEEEEKE